MVKVFGEMISGIDYQARKGVYAVIFNTKRDRVLTVRSGSGHYFLPGGGMEDNESHLNCLERELLEETGYAVVVEKYIGQSMNYFKTRKGEPQLNDGYFYLAYLAAKVQEPFEPDHYTEWICINDCKQLLFHEHQNWAVKEGLYDSKKA